MELSKLLRRIREDQRIYVTYSDKHDYYLIYDGPAEVFSDKIFGGELYVKEIFVNGNALCIDVTFDNNSVMPYIIECLFANKK